MSFAHLHVHTIYSLLDGFSNIKKLMQRVKEMEMPAIGLTDHGTMFGAIDFYTEATKAGVKPIIGLETYVAARTMADKDPNFDKKRYHLVLLAQNDTGYKNLLKIASASQLDGFYYKPRVDHQFLSQHSEGLIATTSCLAGEVPQALMAGDLERARKKFDFYFDIFGAENFYVELQNHDIPELPGVNQALMDLNKRYNAQYVATNDVHYVDASDYELQDVLLAIQTSKLLDDPDRMRMSDASYHLRSPAEMQALFGDVPGALSNTLAIAERCNVDLGFKGYHLPLFPLPPGETAETELRKLCQQGARERYADAANSEAIQTRLDYELGIINKMGFDAYFLIVWDLCNEAAKRGIWYTARGSAAGSIVAYCLKITTVDPIDQGLIFERFLNPGRVSMPDIDLDFPDDRRAEMMAYCADKYGHDKVAQIITFGTLKARAAVRDVGRVMNIPLDEVDKVAKLIPAIPGKPVTIDEAIEQVPELAQFHKNDTQMRRLLDTAKHMEGVVRNAGTHAAGVVITDKPVIDYAPLHRPTNKSGDIPIKTVTQFEMNIVDQMGLLKVDFLGLTTLTVMARACELIKQRHGKSYNLYNIPVDEPKAFEWMGKGNTAGMFQVEGSGMTRFIMEMKPQNLDNVIAMIALFRPGPMDFIPSYIQRMHGEQETTYMHPALEPIFEETYGIAVYQEQIMRAAVDIAGYTNSEADDLRKAIAKKIQEKLLKHRQKFVNGASDRGVMPKETADEIFNNWLEFARYGFNKSHAAVYGVIAVQTAFLKAIYPTEYMTATLSAYKSDTDRVALYVADCRHMGIEVLSPDINTSGWDFTIEDRENEPSCIRFGMGAVKNVGQGPADTIMKTRAESGPFTDISDLARRLDLRAVGKRALESLVKVGALDKLGTRAALLESLDRIISISASHFRAAEAGQMSLFGEQMGMVTRIDLPDLPEDHFDRREVLNWERELIGLYVSEHPLSPYITQLRRVISHMSGELSTIPNESMVRVAGLVTKMRRHMTKSNKPMAFATIEDVQGPIELVVFPNSWKKFQDSLVEDNVIVVEGKIDAKGADPKVLVDNITTEWTYLDPLETGQPRPRLTREDVARKNQVEKSEKASSSPAVPKKQTDSNQKSEPEKEQPEIEIAVPDAPPDWFLQEVSPEFAVEADEIIIPEELSAADANIAGEKPLETPDKNDQAVGKKEVAKEPATESSQKSQPAPATPISAAEPVKTAQKLPPMIPPPRPAAAAEETERPAQRMTITLKANGDRVRDQLKIQRIFGMLISHPGNDYFAFYVFEGDKSYLVEFPNYTTHIDDDLIATVGEITGVESVQVEPIIYQ